MLHLTYSISVAGDRCRNNRHYRVRKMEKKNTFTKRNIWIIAGLLAIIAAVFIAALWKNADKTKNAVRAEISSDGANASAYILCSLPSAGYKGIIPLPEEGSVSYPIRQTLADGTTTENVLHLTPDGFCVESASCANQDCVHQGFVSFENRDTRVLQNGVICLPNQMMAELYTAEEIAQMGVFDTITSDGDN